MTTEEKTNCPLPQCKQFQEHIETKVDEIKIDQKERWKEVSLNMSERVKASTMRWAVGITLVVSIALAGVAFSVLHAGQMVNTERIGLIRDQITTDLNELRQEMRTELKAIQVELNRLNLAIVGGKRE